VTQRQAHRQPLDRVPVQGDGPYHLGVDHPGRKAYPGEVKPPGTITWAEHTKAWEAYKAMFGGGQSAERILERRGFSYGELTMLLGDAPKTWQPHER